VGQPPARAPARRLIRGVFADDFFDFFYHQGADRRAAFGGDDLGFSDGLGG